LILLIISIVAVNSYFSIFFIFSLTQWKPSLQNTRLNNVKENMTTAAIIAAAQVATAGAATYGAAMTGKQANFAEKQAKKAEYKLNQTEAENKAKIDARNKKCAGMNMNLMSGDANASSGAMVQ
jgi:RNA 3'-terminal phosphate cyclase